jgi:hypothetical protein
MELSSQLHTLVTLPTGNNPGTHQIGGCVGPTAGPDILEKRHLACAGIQTLDHPAHSLDITLTTLLWPHILHPTIKNVYSPCHKH